MNNGLRDSAEKFVNHDSLVILWNRVKGLLDDMTAESIHGEIESITTDSFCNLDYLFWSTVLKTSLNQKVTKTVDHQRISLGNNGLNNIILLLGGTDFKLLLQED